MGAIQQGPVALQPNSIAPSPDELRLVAALRCGEEAAFAFESLGQRGVGQRLEEAERRGGNRVFFDEVDDPLPRARLLVIEADDEPGHDAQAGSRDFNDPAAHQAALRAGCGSRCLCIFA